MGAVSELRDHLFQQRQRPLQAKVPVRAALDGFSQPFGIVANYGLVVASLANVEFKAVAAVGQREFESFESVFGNGETRAAMAQQQGPANFSQGLCRECEAYRASLSRGASLPGTSSPTGPPCCAHFPRT